MMHPARAEFLRISGSVLLFGIILGLPLAFLASGAWAQQLDSLSAGLNSPGPLLRLGIRARGISKFREFNSSHDLVPAEVQLPQDLQRSGLHGRRFQHRFHGLDVIGSQVIETTGPQGTDVVDTLSQFDLNPIPNLSPLQALSIALGASHGAVDATKGPELKVLPGTMESAPRSARLIYEVHVSGGDSFDGSRVWIDANTGVVISVVPHHIEIFPVDVYSAKSPLGLPCGHGPVGESCRPLIMNREQFLSLPKTASDGMLLPGADDASKRALGHALQSVRYYRLVHGRNGFDDQGTRVENVVHVGRNFANAYWSSSLHYMGYGDGDGTTMADPTFARDIAGHEFTHAVVESSAGLDGEGMPGALNEAIADLFGEMIEGRMDWRIGADASLAPPPQLRALRDLARPSSMSFTYRDATGRSQSKSYPTLYSEYTDLRDVSGRCFEDRCGIHLNSTIISHAGYLMYQRIGANAEQIWYAALTGYLSQLSNFSDFASANVAACGQLFGEASNECHETVRVFEELGFPFRRLQGGSERVLNLR